VSGGGELGKDGGKKERGHNLMQKQKKNIRDKSGRESCEWRNNPAE